MQKVVFTCDHCGDVIGAKAHISLNVSGNGTTSGIAIPPKTPGNDGSGWKVVHLVHSFLHLHGKCAGPFFNGAVKAKVATKKK